MDFRRKIGFRWPDQRKSLAKTSEKAGFRKSNSPLELRKRPIVPGQSVKRKLWHYIAATFVVGLHGAVFEQLKLIAGLTRGEKFSLSLLVETSRDLTLVIELHAEKSILQVVRTRTQLAFKVRQSLFTRLQSEHTVAIYRCGR